MEFPTGTVTFLFTDIEGSTKIAREHPDTWEKLRHRHHDILYAGIQLHNGFVFQIIGDAFCAAFHTAGDAIRAALKTQQDLQTEKWGESTIDVRMGIHTGKAEFQGGSEYQGYLTMSRVQRVMSVAYGGQILLSNTSAELIRGELPEDISLLDMKEHRLKGVLNPEHLWQVVAPGLLMDFPPLQSLNEVPSNLPIQLTSFIGREKEIIELRGKLDDHHLITLTGSGGTGKTRLSLQVAAEVIDIFPDGVWFLELAPVTDPALIPYTLANLLGLRESGDSRQSINELICGYLQSKKVLLVFDNCEHLIEACARFADLLLRSCKNLKILASSREALGVEGEMTWHVPSLSLPNPDNLPAIEQLSQYEAVRLFIERANLVLPQFMVSQENAPAVAQVCSRLDGIPLAIELAAARINVLTVEQIARRLDDRFRLLTGGSRTALPRQQTLRAMIDWSYKLLSEEEQLLFRRLAVFVGGWSLEAAEAVCSGEGIEDFMVLDLLSQLVKKSLVVMTTVNGESRYHRLETIRQYGREKLFETAEAAYIRDKHLDIFILLAEQGFEELWGANDLVWIEKLEMENDNFRSALSWSLESPDIDPQKSMQLSSALQDFWDTRGYTTEGIQWLSEALKKAPNAPTTHRCRALQGAALHSIRLSRFKDASKYQEESLDLARQLNIPDLIIQSLLLSIDVGLDPDIVKEKYKEGIALARSTKKLPQLVRLLCWWSTSYAENTAETIRCIQEANDIAEKIGNARLRASVLHEYGGIEMRRNNYESAISKNQESLRINLILKDKHATAHNLMKLGRIASQQGDFAAATQYEVKSLKILQDLSDRSCTLVNLHFLGWNALLAGEMNQADEHLQASLTMCREFDLSDYIVLPAMGLGRLAVRLGDWQMAKSYFLEALQSHRNYPEPYFLLPLLEDLCVIPGISVDKCARFIGHVNATREKKNYLLPPSERYLVEPVIERIKTQLGDDAFNLAVTAGMELTYPQVIDEAIQVLQNLE